MLALAGGLAVAHHRRTEPGQHECAHQKFDRLAAAPHQVARLREERPFVVGEQIVRQLAVRRTEHQMRKQPVGLRRGATEAVAEAGANEPDRRRRKNLEIEESAQRGLGRQRQLVSVDGDGGVERGVAVHRRRRTEHAVWLAVPGAGILAEIVDRSRSNRDQRIASARRSANLVDGFAVRMDPVWQDDACNGEAAGERAFDPLTKDLMGGLIADHRDRLPEIEARDQIGFRAGERTGNDDRSGRDLDGGSRIRVNVGPVEQSFDLVFVGHLRWWLTGTGYAASVLGSRTRRATNDSSLRRSSVENRRHSLVRRSRISSAEHAHSFLTRWRTSAS